MSLSVIIIDDDPVAVFLHQFAVRQSGLSIDPKGFLSGKEALDYLDTRDHSSKPCLLLLDINMQQMNGWEFLEAINTRPYAEFIFVTIVSSSVDTSDRKKAEQFNRVIGYLEKPLDANALHDFISVSKGNTHDQ